MNEVSEEFKSILSNEEGLKFIRQMRKRPVYTGFGMSIQDFFDDRESCLDPKREFFNLNGGFKVLNNEEKEYFMNIPVNKSSCLINILARRVQLAEAWAKNNVSEVKRLINLGVSFSESYGDYDEDESKKIFALRVQKTLQLIEKINSKKLTEKDIDEIGDENGVIVNFISGERFLVEFACDIKNEKLIEKLVDCGADATMALKYAVSNNKPKLVKKLIDNGAFLNIYHLVRTCIESEEPNAEIVNMLLIAKGKIEYMQSLPNKLIGEQKWKKTYDLMQRCYNNYKKSKIFNKIKKGFTKVTPWIINIGATTFLLTRLMNPIIGTISSALLVGIEFSLRNCHFIRSRIFGKIRLNPPKELNEAIKNYHNATGNLRKYVSNDKDKNNWWKQAWYER